MEQRFYFVVGITALAGLWFVYDLGYRGVILAAYRNRLFQLRFELFRMAMDGKIAFDSDLYRSVEILFNGLVRYAHLVSYSGYKLTRRTVFTWEVDEDFLKIASSIKDLPPETSCELQKVLEDTHYALATYMACTSPVFLFLAMRTGIKHAWKRSFRNPEHASYAQVFEMQAYRVEKQRALKLAHAA